MQSVAHRPPGPSPEEFDTTWADVFHARDTHARRWHYRLGGAIPLQEFQSYGNLLITRLLASYDPQACPVPFLTALRANLRCKLADVWHAEYAGLIQCRGQRGTRRRRVRAWDAEHASPYAPPEAAPAVAVASTLEEACTLREVARYLAHRFPPEVVTVLLESMESKSDYAGLGYTRKGFRYKVGKVRRTLDPWAQQCA